MTRTTKKENHARRLVERKEIEATVLYDHVVLRVDSPLVTQRYSRGYATIAALEVEGTHGVQWLYGLSICAPGDQFNRAEGRKRALRRLIRIKRLQPEREFSIGGRRFLSQLELQLGPSVELRRSQIPRSLLVTHIALFKKEVPKWLRQAVVESSCAQTQQWEAWSGRVQIALKCPKCNKLTLHVAVLKRGEK